MLLHNGKRMARGVVIDLITHPRVLIVLGVMVVAVIAWSIDRGIAQAEKDLDGY